MISTVKDKARVLALGSLATMMALAVIPSTAAAQTNFLGGIHFNSGFPQEELKEQLDRNAYGVGGQFLFAPSTSPLAIGFDVSWMNYGSESRREPFSTTIPDVTVDVETMNNVVGAFFVLRGQVPRGPIQIYADALVGFHYLYTETTISDTDDVLDDIASSTNQDDAAFAYGGGGGVMVPLWHSEFPSDSVQQVLLDAGVRYIKGDEAEYLKKGSIRHADGAATFDTVKSRTDMVKLHVGVALRF